MSAMPSQITIVSIVRSTRKMFPFDGVIMDEVQGSNLCKPSFKVMLMQFFMCYVRHRVKTNETFGDPFYKHRLTLNPARMPHHIHHKVWNEITFPSLNFNGFIDEVWRRIGTFFPHFTGHVCQGVNSVSTDLEQECWEPGNTHIQSWRWKFDNCYTATRYLGWGLLSQFPPFRYFPHSLSLSKHTLATEYHVNIWQVSPQLRCGDTCLIWMWFK